MKEEKPPKNKKEADIVEEIQDLLDELGIDEQDIPKNKKGLGIAFSAQLIPNPILNYICTLIINGLLLLALCGYIDVISFSNWLDMTIFLILLTTTELLLKFILYKYLLGIIFRTLGIVLILPIIISVGTAYLLTPNVAITNMGGFIALFIFFLIIRFLASQYIIRLTKKKLFK